MSYFCESCPRQASTGQFQCAATYVLKHSFRTDICSPLPQSLLLFSSGGGPRPTATNQGIIITNLSTPSSTIYLSCLVYSCLQFRSQHHVLVLIQPCMMIDGYILSNIRELQTFVTRKASRNEPAERAVSEITWLISDRDLVT